MIRTIFTFALLIIAIFLLFRLSEYSILKGNLSAEIVLASVAVIFFFIGLYINKRSAKTKIPPGDKLNQQKIDELGLSKREYEVLQEIANGLSNKQIADKLFVSESTVKTHVSNVLLKLDAQRRTQAVGIAKKLGILH